MSLKTKPALIFFFSFLLQRSRSKVWLINKLFCRHYHMRCPGEVVSQSIRSKYSIAHVLFTRVLQKCQQRKPGGDCTLIDWSRLFTFCPVFIVHLFIIRDLYAPVPYSGILSKSPDPDYHFHALLLFELQITRLPKYHTFSWLHAIGSTQRLKSSERIEFWPDAHGMQGRAGLIV